MIIVKQWGKQPMVPPPHGSETTAMMMQPLLTLCKVEGAKPNNPPTTNTINASQMLTLYYYLEPFPMV